MAKLRRTRQEQVAQSYVGHARSFYNTRKPKTDETPLTYLYYPDEPHDYCRPENWASFWAVAELFLAQHLGGQYEPYGNDLRGTTSMQVIAVEQFVPGLAVALTQHPA